MDSIQFTIHEKARRLGARKAPLNDDANVEWVEQTVRRFALGLVKGQDAGVAVRGQGEQQISLVMEGVFGSREDVGSHGALMERPWCGITLEMCPATLTFCKQS